MKTDYEKQRSEYERGWNDARTGKLDWCPDNASSSYKKGYLDGVVAKEQANNYDSSDYQHR